MCTYQSTNSHTAAVTGGPSLQSGVVDTETLSSRIFDAGQKSKFLLNTDQTSQPTLQLTVKSWLTRGLFHGCQKKLRR
ncbi:hypothetical protein M9X92_011053 [Pyricularia oryzae]|nr:hypothetical protein M9X92_011053 [Pyricularia oryzae]